MSLLRHSRLGYLSLVPIVILALLKFYVMVNLEN